MLRERLRGALRRFLGLNELATMDQAAAVRAVADGLLRVHRVFGDPARVTLGEHVILNDALINTSSGKVSIHDHAFCGHGVSILTGSHDLRRTGYMRQAGVPQQGRDIVIGRGVWIASNATVLGPCTIGDNAVIAAGAVVTGLVEEGWVYGGVPAHPLRKIDFDQPPHTS